LTIFCIVCLVALVSFQPGFAASTDSTARPNIVLMIADDMAWDDCGPYGNKKIQTPNLDRLAREGMRFDRALLTCSSCSPSRSSMITGRYPHSTDAEQLHWPLPREQITFVEKLKAAGYWTAQAGKWHLGDAVRDRFDVVKEADAAAFQLTTDKSGKAAKMISTNDASGCAQWIPTLRERPKGKPFFLWLAAFDPHRDYEQGIIPRPHQPGDVTVPPYLPDTIEVRRDLVPYYDEITRLDSYVGKVLDELQAQGVAQNTVVIFTSDNGRPFPRCKTTVYDSGIKTPLFIRWPNKVMPGSACGSLVSSVDYGPTILELAGLGVPASAGGSPPKGGTPSFQGKSFLPLLTNPQSKVRDYVFAEHNWHDYDAHKRAVRSERFKYIRNFDADLPLTPSADNVRSPTYLAMRKLRDEGKLKPEQMGCFIKLRPEEELYDVDADPHELKNLAGDPKHAAMLQQLRAELEKWQQETGDPKVMPRAKDEFDRETGEPLPNRQRPRPTKQQLVESPRR
jgi:arylsulfatase A-like enzyme